jgi:hypothetical protein
MKFRWQPVVILALFIAGGGWLFWDSFSPVLFGVGDNLSKLEEFVLETRKAADRVIHNPPPLRFEGGSGEAHLTLTGVVDETNLEREIEGLSPLALSSRLNSIARIKVEDMFARQYFAHDAPDGRDAADLAEEQGYEFVSIGENLALGNFQDDRLLVEGWMNSPGHRENILREGYEEIGVAVKKDVYQGKEVWMAVQIFGRPLSSCPAPDERFKDVIDRNNEQLANLAAELKILRDELDKTPKNDPSYNDKTEEYNLLVDAHNNLLGETKSLIQQYNATVNEFNACVNAP